MNMGKFAEAKLEAEQGYNMAQELGYPEMLRNSSEVLSRIYRHTGDYKKALEMHILFKQMSDSLNSENHRKASIQKAFQFEYDKKLAADSVRSLQERKVHELELYREKSQRNYLYAGLGLLITLAGFIFQRFRVTRKQNKIIEEQKKAVDSAYALLHEKNKEVLDSIHYAKRIQDSFLPTNKFLESKLGKK
jgi:hypothetical protein